jgi:hypothetical protein
MNYLRYIEHSAENLQFYLWFKDFEARWEKLPESEKALAQSWTTEHAETEISAPARPRRVNPQVAAVFKGTDFADGPPKSTDKVDPFDTPHKSSVEDKRDMMSDYDSSMDNEKTMASSQIHSMAAAQAFDEAGMKWKPCEHRPNLQICTPSD